MEHEEYSEVEKQVIKRILHNQYAIMEALIENNFHSPIKQRLIDAMAKSDKVANSKALEL